jgi:hypothetical protein
MFSLSIQGVHHAKQNKPDLEKTNTACFLSYVESGLKKRHGQKTGTGGEASRRWKGERENVGENMI